MLKKNKQEVLAEIFADDELGLLLIKDTLKTKSADERLVASFMEIVNFYLEHGNEPKAIKKNIDEYQLFLRLKNLREDKNMSLSLEKYDVHKLLLPTQKDINSLDDIFDDDQFNILEADDEGLFDIKNIKEKKKNNKTDFVARRKPCKDFEKYQQIFKDIHNDLKIGRRKLIPYKEKQLNELNRFFVHNGMVLLLEKINDFAKDKFHKDDGRTRIIFENGTESNMKLRSLGKNLLKNGKAITSDTNRYNEDFLKSFNDISKDDDESGYIYVLKSRSLKSDISSINNLYKIGYTTNDVTQRIRNAKNDPTYLMSDVDIIGVWKCFNMNPHKFENILQIFFEKCKLDIDVIDNKGKLHRPTEWFVVPLDIINEAIDMIMSGSIVNYEYDYKSEKITIKKSSV